MGVPVVIGQGGVEQIVNIELSADERAMLEKSGASVKKVIDIVKAQAPG